MFSFAPNSDTRSQLEKDLDNIQFKEPLSDHTKKTRRSLIVFALVGILLGTFKFRINSFFGLGFTQESVPPDIILGVLFLVNLYFLFSFFLYLSSDIIIWNYEDQRIKILPHENVATLVASQTAHIESHFKTISETLSTLLENKENIPEELKKKVDLAFHNHAAMTTNVFKFNENVQKQLEILEKSLKSIKKINIRFYGSSLFQVGSLKSSLPAMR